jgi:hypothetical protein
MFSSMRARKTKRIGLTFGTDILNPIGATYRKLAREVYSAKRFRDARAVRPRLCAARLAQKMYRSVLDCFPRTAKLARGSLSEEQDGQKQAESEQGMADEWS